MGVLVRKPTVLLVMLVLIVGSTAGSAADRDVDLEITVGDIQPSSSDQSTWGWWNPGKYDEWNPDERSKAVLADVRLLFGGTTYTVVLAGEWAPDLDGVGVYADPASGEPVTENLSIDVSAYDLGLGQVFGQGGKAAVMPWIGATYLRLNESRVTIAPDASTSESASDEARASIWGVVVGADARVTVWARLELFGRVLGRWAKGTRDTKLATQNPGGGSGGTAKESDSVDRTMWGADLGLRWAVGRSSALEGGWRIRDWSLDDGPGTFTGPYLRVVLGF
jgi:hypothetical protein